MSPRARTSPAPRVPGLARRALSMAYEALVVLALLLFASLAFLAMASAPLAGGMRYLFQLYLFLVLGAYFVACWTRGGRTLPMQAWRIRVVRGDGAAIGIGRAILRYLFAWISLLLLGAGFLWALFDRDGQYLHDRFTGTRMVLDGPNEDQGSVTTGEDRNSPRQ